MLLNISRRAFTRVLALVLASTLLLYVARYVLKDPAPGEERNGIFNSSPLSRIWNNEDSEGENESDFAEAVHGGDHKVKTSQAPSVSEVTVTTELTHYIHSKHPRNAKSLFLTMTQDATGWGHAHNEPRSLDSHIALIKKTSGLPLKSISIAIQTASATEYQKYIHTLNKHPFAKIQVLLYQPEQHDDEPEDRHSEDFQPIRRKQISLARNMLMLRALGSEEHIFWYDGDVIGSDNGIAAKMIDHSQNGLKGVTTNSSMLREPPLPIGLITARCENPGMNNYDLNAWALPKESPAAARTRPDGEQIKDLSNGKLYMASSTGSMIYVDHWTDHTTNDELFPLDSVGGTILYIKADLVRKGLNFPPYFVVGTSWDLPNGYDGIETEGLCYIAKTIGYGCYALGGTWHIKHEH